MTRAVFHIVGARPNFMKMAPVLEAFAAEPGEGLHHLLVHTGQHYDEHLNDAIFRDLGLRAPDIHLGVGSGTHAEQTSKIMLAIEELVVEHEPAMVHVAGDVNSTLACSLVAAKAHVPVAHLEAGLRSFDRRMPEEINRIITDRIANLHLTPSADADQHLLDEGVDASSIVRVGNCMIDSLHRRLAQAKEGDALSRFGLEPQAYALATIHRPSNVDAPDDLKRVLASLGRIAEKLPVLFPMHPRTRHRLEGLAIDLSVYPGLQVSEPLGYLDFLQLQSEAKVIMTDSGGIQEESTALGVPCLTLRENTERPVTVTEGTNTVIGTDPDRLVEEVDGVLAGRGKAGRVPELWDGKAGPRVAEAIRSFLSR